MANETEIKKIKNVNVVFHQEETINNEKVKTESLRKPLHPVIEVVSTSKEFGKFKTELNLNFCLLFPVFPVTLYRIQPNP